MIEKSSYTKGCEIQVKFCFGFNLMFARLGMQVCSCDLNVKSTNVMTYM